MMMRLLLIVTLVLGCGLLYTSDAQPTERKILEQIKFRHAQTSAGVKCDKYACNRENGGPECVNECTSGNMKCVRDPPHSRKRRAVIPREDLYWKKNDQGFVEIPYRIDATSANVSGAFMQAVARFEQKTCIRLRPKRDNDTDFLRVVSDDGCYVRGLGNTGGDQILSLEADTFCGNMGVAIHEVMHKLGFHHEMNRVDRDHYVLVNFSNIQSGSGAYQYQKVGYGEGMVYGVEYDIRSVMHYGRYAASNGLGPAMTNLNDPDDDNMGQFIDFTPKDIRKINLQYKCRGYDGYVDVRQAPLPL